MNIKPALLLGVAAVAAFFPRISHADDVLRLSATDGKVPMTVRIVGPKQLLEQGNGHFAKDAGCGYTIDWGDLPGVHLPRGPVGEDCSLEMRHTYEQEALYNVKATIYHLGPAGESITDWKGEAVLRVIR